MFRFNQADNRDPRWSDADNAAIEQKVDEALAHAPRLELADPETGQPINAQERRHMLLVSFREIAKATSIDNVLCAPPAMLEQISVLAAIRNPNVKGELVQLIRVVMLVYASPETNAAASDWLAQLEDLARRVISPAMAPELVQWRPLPGSPNAWGRGPVH